MSLIRFASDYQEGAHPRILMRMMDSNYIQSPGYGEDGVCKEWHRYERHQGNNIFAFPHGGFL